ncbi:MAG: restriction endonuclease subunit S [Helicobacter sp.]|nr:restriction endonuclease subunit S [Helicobacter sp.]
MESYIAELESQRIAELNAYLKATNLSDYELTEEEMEALKTFENLVAKLDSNPCHTESTPCHVERSEVSSFCHVERSETSHQSETSTIRDASLMAQHDKVGKTAQNDKMGENVESQNDKVSPATAEGGLQASAYKTNPPITFKEFKIGELFSVKSNPQLNKDSFEFSENGEYPYFTRTCLNNGINGYVEYLDEEHKIKGNSIAVGMLGMQFFYMKKDFYAGQFTKTIYPKFGELNTKIALYFISMFNKSSQHFLRGLVRDFENLFVNHKIYLPITSDQKIAFDFMESFIKAIEKQTIKGVVEFANKNIEATKRVVQNIS